MERWVPIPGHLGYEVSDQGRVRSVDRIVPHPRGNLTLQGKVLQPSVSGKKYLAVKLGAKSRTWPIHNLVLLAFQGEANGQVVRHLNGDRLDNRLENLEYGTSEQNSHDMVQHKTQWQQAKTHCPAGHLLEEPNLMPSQLRLGHRQCLACGRARTTIKNHPLSFQEAADIHYRKIMVGVSD